MRSSRSHSRKDVLGLLVPPVPRFFAGLLSMPAFLLIDDVAFKAVLVLVYAVLAILSGKRLRWMYYLLLIASVTIFHLFVPWGRVLMTLGPLRITMGALEKGLTRGLTLTGMVFLSVATVRPELRFPGRFGGLLGRTFRHFDRIFEGRQQLERRDLMGSLDRLLIERFDPSLSNYGMTQDEESEGRKNRSPLTAAFIILVPVSLSWGMWILSLL